MRDASYVHQCAYRQQLVDFVYNLDSRKKISIRLYDKSFDFLDIEYNRIIKKVAAEILPRLPLQAQIHCFSLLNLG